ncbi:hypothetical protein HDK77DRAFT_267613 [Phyllosticta capitalensis]
MADTMRPVSFLPGIKCSDCGVEVEISMLADHICAGTPVAPSAAPDPPPTQEAGLKSMRSFFDRAAELSTTNSPFLDPNALDPESPTKSQGGLLPRTPRSGASRTPLSPRPPKSGNILERMNAIAPGPFDQRRPSPSPKPSPKKASRDQFPVGSLGASPFDEYERPPSPPPKATPPPPKKDESRESRSRFHKRSETLSSLRNRSRSRSTRGSFGDFHRRHASTVSSEKAAPVGLPQGPKARPPPARPARPQDVDEFLEQLQEEKTPTPVVPRPLTIRKESISTAKTPISLPRRPSDKIPQSPPQFSSPPPSNDSVPEWWQSPNKVQAKEIYVPSERLESENARRFPRRTSSKGVNNMRPGYDDAPPLPVTGLRRPPALSHAPSDSASSESSGFDGRSRDSTNSTPPTSAGSTPTTDFSTRVIDKNPFVGRKPSSGKLYEPYRSGASIERPRTANGRRGTDSNGSGASTERPGTSGSRPGTSSGRPGTSDSRPGTSSSRSSRPSTSHSRSATVSNRQAPLVAPPVLSPYASDRSEYSDRPRTSNGRPGNERPRMPYEFDAPDSPFARFDMPVERPRTSNGPRLHPSTSRPDLNAELPPVPRKSPSRQNLQQAARPAPLPPINTSVQPPPSLDQPESPMDPAIQKGLFTPISLRPSDSSAFPEISTVFQSAEKPAPPPARESVEKPPMPPMPVSAPKSPARPRADSAGRRTARPTKGNCRGCGQAIVGKSVKAADGSLSGRWHKQCFVCMTCRAPFVTTDFYVLNDQPYCARHYHQNNGSLCCGCDTGIEGQYVESERRAKFHPQCFQCGICRVTLRDDYFEFMGVAYCERHAFHVARQANSGPGRGGMLMPGGARRNPERRRTRLMMM